MAAKILGNFINESQKWIHSKNDSDIDRASADVADDHYDGQQNLDYDQHADDNNSLYTHSEASEIANLADVSISDHVDYPDCPECDDDDDDLTEAKKQKEIMDIIIEKAKLTTATSVDLSKRKLLSFPKELSKLSHLEYIYLEGNKILSLPDDFFKMFPRLRWLDLRNNLLSTIPCSYLSSHTCLRNILLEGNNLRNLPLELGLVKSLHGLNIAGNPLDFPPQEIIEGGTQNILKFLKDLYEKKCSHLGDLELNLSEKVPEECEHFSMSSDDWNTSASLMELAKKREMHLKNKLELGGNWRDRARATKPGKLYKPFSNTRVLPQDVENMKRFREPEVVNRTKKKTKESKLSWRLNPNPPLPTQDHVAFKKKEEEHLAKVKEFKEKIDVLIQKQKDEAMIKKWRDVAKLLQQKKYSQRMQPGKDYVEPGERAPFAIETDLRKCLSKEDRLKADLQREVEIKEQRQVSTATKMWREQERQRRIFDLEQKISHHTSAMVKRRKGPKGNPQQDLEIARRELRLAEQLHSELMAQKREL